MNKFKEGSIKTYGWELSYSNELGKNKLPKDEKKYIRRLSRNKLKRIKNEEE
jgi:hypothetical protein